MAEEKTTDKVELKVDDLAKITDYMEKQKEIDKAVEDLKAGQLSDEVFKGKVEELVKGQLEDHEKAFNHEKERRITFDSSTITTDKAAIGIAKAVNTPNHSERQKRFESALTINTGNEDIKALQELNDDLLIIDAIMKGGVHSDRYIASGGMRSLNTFKRYQEQLDSVIKAVAPMDTTDTANFVPTALSADILDLPWLYGNVEMLFEHLPMPTNPYTVPVDLTPVTTMASNISEATTNTNNPGDTHGQSITDGLMTLDAGKLRSRMITSAELDEEAVILWLPYIRKRLTTIVGNTVEACDLNGDTTATHQDTDIEALGADDGRTTWKGLRKLMIAGSLTVDCSTGNLNEANLLKIKAKCGVYGVVPQESAWIFGIQSYLSQVIKLDGCKKVNEYGPKATLISGELSNYYGSPVLVSAHQREDTTTAGINGASGNTKGVCMYVNKNYWYHGDRRLVTLKAEDWITTDQINLVCFRRMDFQAVVTPSTTYSFGALGINFVPGG